MTNLRKGGWWLAATAAWLVAGCGGGSTTTTTGGTSSTATLAGLNEFLSTSSANMYLQVTRTNGTTIAGESVDKTHAGWIDISSLAVSFTDSVNIGSAGAGAGKAKLGDLVIQKAIDKSSPIFFEMLGNGDHATSAVVEVTSGATSAKGEVVRYRLTANLVFIPSLTQDLGQSVDPGSAEQLDLAYGALTLTYYPQKADGSLDTAVAQTWNQVTNTNSTSIPRLSR